MEEKTFLTVDEVADILSVSKSKAYEIVRQLNKQLKEKGFITVAAESAEHILMKECAIAKSSGKELIICRFIKTMPPASGV